jgi:hypothetical protein
MMQMATISLIVFGRIQVKQVAIGAKMAFLRNLQLHLQEVVQMHILIAETVIVSNL